MVSASLVPGAICVTLEDQKQYFHIRLNDKVLFDARCVTSISRKMAVELNNACPTMEQFIKLDEKQWRSKSQHLSSSLRVDSSHFVFVSHLSKELPESEIERFAESSDFEGSPASPSCSRKVVEITPTYEPVSQSLEQAMETLHVPIEYSSPCCLFNHSGIIRTFLLREPGTSLPEVVSPSWQTTVVYGRSYNN